ncbi:Rv3235 family protein [uncultured Aeromicrobium sp.]|uniref:Rv3235 family protein n=1 Tax=uncultured Aeromicrobium sp. TaxID=337820 RepID=UPI0025D6E970|nr:Rv3235 family protein [uncultured Aeromicrobium sp.]
MLTATAFATERRPDRRELDDQIPLPFPPAPPVLPAPVERNGTGELRDRSARFVQAVVEVIHGHRPVRQLGPWMTVDVFEHLQDHLHQRRVRASRHRARLASVHVSMVRDGAAEIAGRMVHDGRSHAIALRLERDDAAPRGPMWRCTALTWA